MASSSAFSNLFFGIQVFEKLTKSNHALWQAQILTAIRGARLKGHINGKTVAPAAKIDAKQGGTTTKVPNPTYEEWFTRDQQVLGFIFTSTSKDVLGQIATTSMVAEAWPGVADIFSAHTHARSVNVRLALATTKKGAMTITEFVNKMTTLGNDKKATEKPLDNDEMVAYIHNGLDHDSDSIVSVVMARVEPITVAELYSQLFSFEK